MNNMHNSWISRERRLGKDRMTKGDVFNTIIGVFAILAYYSIAMFIM